jgi:selenocysteine lyase/cysteine desulfurase
MVPCADGRERPYLSLDAAASTQALPAVAQAVEQLLHVYSSVHRGAGYKSQLSTQAYEETRYSALDFAGRDPDRDTVIICRNTTEAINHLAFRLGLRPMDTVVTTVVEHHANLLPWRRYARCKYVECGSDGTFEANDVASALDECEQPRIVAITGASNITGFCPDIDAICEVAHQRGVPVALDAAQLAPHRQLPSAVDFVSFSGHKIYAPFGSGVLIGPRNVFAEGEPFLAGGGAVELVDLDEVVWTSPPEREEAGSPNVIGAVALTAAMDSLRSIGWDEIADHDRAVAERLRRGLESMPSVRVLGPRSGDLLPVVTFTVEGMHHGLVAARLSAEHAIGVRHGCFCAHPYLIRLLGLSPEELDAYRSEVRRGVKASMPGAVRVSAGLSTSLEDVDRFLDALEAVSSSKRPPVPYIQDPSSGDFAPDPEAAPWFAPGSMSPACGRS